VGAQSLASTADQNPEEDNTHEGRGAAGLETVSTDHRTRTGEQSPESEGVSMAQATAVGTLQRAEGKDGGNAERLLSGHDP
jgi:hypothetical protein